MTIPSRPAQCRAYALVVLVCTQGESRWLSSHEAPFGVVVIEQKPTGEAKATIAC